MKTTLNKLNEKQLEHLRKLAVAIKRIEKCDDEYDKELFNYRKGNINGYLKALVDMEIISESDQRTLYTYFTERR